MVVAQELILNVYSGVTGEYSAPVFTEQIKLETVCSSFEELKEIAEKYAPELREPDNVLIDFTGYNGGECAIRFIWENCKEEEGEEYDYEVILDVVSTFCVMGG
jgi:hypothetical protein